MPEDPVSLPELRVRIARATRRTGKTQDVLEKDYVLSYLLAGIADVPALRDSLVFKGGTCLRKIYFAGYRFSVDLDFTVRSPCASDMLIAAVEEATHRARTRLLAYGPFEIQATRKMHRDPHPHDQIDCTVRARFPWMPSALCVLKVEVTTDEPVLMEAITRPLLHTFPGETLNTAIASYQLEEIVAEKLRALLQRREQLRTRQARGKDWIANRPRDLYDLWYLWHQSDLPVDWRTVGQILPEKARARGVVYAGEDDFMDGSVLQGMKSDWAGQLANFVVDLPSFDQCLSTLRILLPRVLE